MTRTSTSTRSAYLGSTAYFVGKVGIARDDKNTSFFVTPISVRTDPGKASIVVSLADETNDFPAANRSSSL